MNERWQALAREAGLAAEHIGIGVTALSKANYAQHAWYGQAFFALSIGLERAAKLALLVDHAIQNGGQFPGNRQFRSFGHDLTSLLRSVDDIASGGQVASTSRRLPRSDIHDGIVHTLTEFALNITRYYNIDLVTGAPGVDQRTDPIAAWFTLVILPAIQKHARRSQLERVTTRAHLIDQLMGSITMVRHHSETGRPLTTVFDASLQTGLTAVAAPHVRLYVLQLVRFLARVLSELGYRAQQARLADVPYLSEFFAIYDNDDAYLKSRKTWSIYRP